MKILDIVCLLASSLLAGSAGGWIQSHIQLKKANKIEKRLRERLIAVEKILPSFDAIRLAKHLFYMGNFDQAIDICNSIILDSPTEVQAFYLRGRAYFKLHKANNALDDFRAAVNLGSRDGEIYLALASAASALNYWTEAETAAKNSIDTTIIESTAKLSDALTLIGNSLREQGKHTEAIEYYERCIERYESHTPAIDGKAKAMMKLAEQGSVEYDDILCWLDTVITDNPFAASTFGIRALVLFKRNRPGDKESALDNLEKCAGLATKNTKPYEMAAFNLIEEAEIETDETKRKNVLSVALICLGKAFSRAARYYKPAIGNLISYVYSLEDDFDKAITISLKSRELAPQFPHNHLAVCGAFFAAKMWEKGIRAARLWLDSEYADESPSTKVRMLAYICLGMLCADQPISMIRHELFELYESRLTIARFLEAWHWEPAKNSILTKLRGTGEFEELKNDIISILSNEPKLEEFRRKWIAQYVSIPTIAIR